jgi:hypothetical protein
MSDVIPGDSYEKEKEKREKSETRLRKDKERIEKFNR